MLKKCQNNKRAGMGLPALKEGYADLIDQQCNHPSNHKDCVVVLNEVPALIEMQKG